LTQLNKKLKYSIKKIMRKLDRIILIFSLTIGLLASTSNLFAQGGIYTPVKWEFSSERISDTEAELSFVATIEDKWHLYSQDIPMSPPATVFVFDTAQGYALDGKVEEFPKAIEEYDGNFEMTLKFFAHEAKGENLFRWPGHDYRSY
jgi:hypothetical protein